MVPLPKIKSILEREALDPPLHPKDGVAHFALPEGEGWGEVAFPSNHLIKFTRDRRKRNFNTGEVGKETSPESNRRRSEIVVPFRNKRLVGVHFYRQQPIGPYIVDFCSRSRKLVIEVDGSQHLDQKHQDDIRTVYLESLGFRVLRFWNDDVLKDTDTVLQVILNALEYGDSAPGES